MKKAAGRAKETLGYIDRIRILVLKPGSDTDRDTLTRVRAEMAKPRKAKSTRRGAKSESRHT
jgi:hypothetical protein